MFKFCSLFSGSTGNSLFVETENSKILVDAGESAKKIVSALSLIGIEVTDIDAILVTHEHIDHVKSLGTLSKKYNIPVYEISAINNQGVDNVLVKIADELDKIKEEPLFNEENFESHVLYKFKKEKPFTITKDNDIYVIKGKEVEKLFRMTKFTDEGAIRFARKLRAMGIDEKLLELGAKYGDKVQIMDLIFEFKE